MQKKRTKKRMKESEKEKKKGEINLETELL
jgi:hypothetical protein